MICQEIRVSESCLSSFLAGHGIRSKGNLQDKEAWTDYMIAIEKSF